MSALKQKLYKSCEDYIEQRIQNIQTAINEAQQAANNETKSTAGDKHDTARAMMQAEVENQSKNLAQAKKIKAFLSSISPDKKSSSVDVGAAVKTSNGNFYISISAGKISDDFFAISLSSPIGQALKNAKAGDEVTFKGKMIEVFEVC